MQPLSRNALARMVASHLPNEGFVNLGIGAPTQVGDYLPAEFRGDAAQRERCAQRRTQAS